MPYSPVSRFGYYRDFAWSFVVIALGRLFPRLHVPHTDLSNKTAIITGGNSGIGFAIALELAERGATVYIACRNALKAEAAVSKITSQLPSSTDRVKALSLDTSSLSSVRVFAQDWAGRHETTRKIDLLFHNAGIGSKTPGQEYTPDGFPLIYATNFLGSFLLTYLLEQYLAPDTRIIFTTSSGQYGGDFIPTFSLTSVRNELEPGFHFPKNQSSSGEVVGDAFHYMNTKTMQVAFAKLLQERFDRQARESGLSSRRLAHAFTPGFTATEIFGKVTVRSIAEDPVWAFLKATNATLATGVAEGAATGVWLASTGDERAVGVLNGGKYWERMVRRLSKVDIMEWETVERLWVRWEADTGVEWR